MRVKPDYYIGRFVHDKAVQLWAEFTRKEVKESGRPYNFRARLAKRFQGWLSKYDRFGYENVQFWPDWLEDPELFIHWVKGELEAQGITGDFTIRRRDVRAGFVPRNLEIKAVQNVDER